MTQGERLVELAGQDRAQWLVPVVADHDPKRLVLHVLMEGLVGGLGQRGQSGRRQQRHPEQVDHHPPGTRPTQRFVQPGPQYRRAERVDHAHHGEHERALADPLVDREWLIGK